jgi:hypothetical protein
MDGVAPAISWCHPIHLPSFGRHCQAPRGPGGRVTRQPPMRYSSPQRPGLCRDVAFGVNCGDGEAREQSR